MAILKPSKTKGRASKASSKPSKIKNKLNKAKSSVKAKKTAVTAKKTAVTAKKTTPKAKKTAPKAKKTAPKAKKTAPKAKKASAKFEKQKLKEDQISKTRVKETNNKITEKRKQKLNTIKRQPPKQVIPSKLDYEIGEYVVYPSHGVGKVTAIEDKLVGEQTLKMFVVIFDKEKMKLRVPVDKTTGSGMRHLSSPSIMEKAISTLKGKARQRRVMWSRRAQEYDAKLNSGDPVAIAEVIRDLFRKGEEPEQSYSERQMYEAAMERLAREYAALEETDTLDATERLEEVLKAA